MLYHIIAGVGSSLGIDEIKSIFNHFIARDPDRPNSKMEWTQTLTGELRDMGLLDENIRVVSRSSVPRPGPAICVHIISNVTTYIVLEMIDREVRLADIPCDLPDGAWFRFAKDGAELNQMDDGDWALLRLSDITGIIRKGVPLSC